MTEDRKDEVVGENTEDAVEEKTEDTLPELVNKIRKEYEMRIAEMEAKHAADIADRDEIIQQLISGNPAENVSHETIADRINNKRKFKKW